MRASSVKVTLTATHGVLTLSGTTSLSFTTGDGTADASMVSPEPSRTSTGTRGAEIHPDTEYTSSASVESSPTIRATQAQAAPGPTTYHQHTVSSMNHAPGADNTVTTLEDTDCMFTVAVSAYDTDDSRRTTCQSRSPHCPGGH